MKLSIKARLILMFFVLITIPMVILGFLSYKMAASSLQTTIEQQLKDNTDRVIESIEVTLDSVKRNLQIASYNQQIIETLNGGSETAKAGTYNFISKIQKDNNDLLEMVILTDSNGKAIMSNEEIDSAVDLSDRDYVKEALKGKVSFSDVLTSKFSNKLIISVGYPIKAGDKIEGVLVGTVTFDNISEHLAEVKVGDNGYAYMIDRQGLFVYHPKKEKVLKENLGDTDNVDLKNLVNKMKAGENSQGFYTYEGIYKYVCFKPVGQWVVAITANYDEYMASAIAIRNDTFLIVAISVLIAMLLAYVMSTTSIVNPLRRLEALMDKAGKGDLTVKSELRSKDEIGKLGNSFNRMIAHQMEIVGMVRNGAVELAAASEETAAASEEISAASQQINSSIYEVATGAEKQSETIIEVSKVLIQLSSLVQLAQSKANATDEKALQAMQVAEQGRIKVKETVTAMDIINQSTNKTAEVLLSLNEISKKVSGIITTINSIAGQTNLLALNASIEAARAGEHGKGFTVVADQVRKLSEESNIEAKQIASLVNDMLKEIELAVTSMEYGKTAVENGVRIADETDESFISIIGAVEQIVKNIEEIVDITKDEVATSDEVVKLIDTVATVTESTAKNSQEVLAAVQEQTSTSESLSAGAEETSTMATQLEDTVKIFKID